MLYSISLNISLIFYECILNCPRYGWGFRLVLNQRFLMTYSSLIFVCVSRLAHQLKINHKYTTIKQWLGNIVRDTAIEDKRWYIACFFECTLNCPRYRHYISLRMTSHWEIYWNRTWPIYQIHYKPNVCRFLLLQRNLVLIWISMIPGIMVFFFYRSPLNMVAREINSNENNNDTFFYTESEPEYQENFPEDS